MLYEKIKDFDALFMLQEAKSLVVNDLDVESEEGLKQLKQKLMVEYDDDKVSLLPTCVCGALKNEYRRGEVCHECGTTVQSPFEDIKPILWYRAIEGSRFILPTIWVQVDSELNKSSSILRWVCDPNYNVVKTIGGHKIVNIIKAIPNFERSYSWLINNFTDMLEIINIYKKSPELDILIKLIKDNEKKVFPHYLPILNRHMFIAEKVGKLNYMRQNTLGTADTIVSFVKATNSTSKKRLDKAMAKLCYEETQSYKKLLVDYIKGKKGIPRKLIDGFRSYFTVRGVITPIVRPHDKQELELPWGQAVVLFRLHLTNILLKRGYTRIEISRKLNKAVTCFDEEISEIFDMIIKRVQKRGLLGIPVSFQRNPSLLNGSMILLFISVIKKDPADLSIGFSGLLTKLPNADYDGDEMNLQLLLDEWLYLKYLPLKPSTSVANMSAPGKVSGRVTLTDPVVATISSFVINQYKRATQRRKNV